MRCGAVQTGSRVQRRWEHGARWAASSLIRKQGRANRGLAWQAVRERGRTPKHKKKRKAHAPALELNNHQDRADRADDDDEGPQEFAHTRPGVRFLCNLARKNPGRGTEDGEKAYVREGQDGNESHKSDTQSDTAVYLPAACLVWKHIEKPGLQTILGS